MIEEEKSAPKSNPNLSARSDPRVSSLAPSGLQDDESSLMQEFRQLRTEVRKDIPPLPFTPHNPEMPNTTSASTNLELSQTFLDLRAKVLPSGTSNTKAAPSNNDQG